MLETPVSDQFALRMHLKNDRLEEVIDIVLGNTWGFSPRMISQFEMLSAKLRRLEIDQGRGILTMDEAGKARNLILLQLQRSVYRHLGIKDGHDRELQYIAQCEYCRTDIVTDALVCSQCDRLTDEGTQQEAKLDAEARKRKTYQIVSGFFSISFILCLLLSGMLFLVPAGISLCYWNRYNTKTADIPNYSG